MNGPENHQKRKNKEYQKMQIAEHSTLSAISCTKQALYRQHHICTTVSFTGRRDSDRQVAINLQYIAKTSQVTYPQ